MIHSFFHITIKGDDLIVTWSASSDLKWIPPVDSVGIILYSWGERAIGIWISGPFDSGPYRPRIEEYLFPHHSLPIPEASRASFRCPFSVRKSSESRDRMSGPFQQHEPWCNQNQHQPSDQRFRHPLKDPIIHDFWRPWRYLSIWQPPYRDRNHSRRSESILPIINDMSQVVIFRPWHTVMFIDPFGNLLGYECGFRTYLQMPIGRWRRRLLLDHDLLSIWMDIKNTDSD